MQWNKTKKTYNTYQPLFHLSSRRYERHRNCAHGKNLAEAKKSEPKKVFRAPLSTVNQYPQH